MKGPRKGSRHKGTLLCLCGFGEEYHKQQWVLGKALRGPSPIPCCILLGLAHHGCLKAACRNLPV